MPSMIHYVYNARAGMLTQENSKFNDNLGYIARTCLKKTKTKKPNKTPKHPKHKNQCSSNSSPSHR